MPKLPVKKPVEATKLQFLQFRAIHAYAELRRKGYGRDSWMAFEEGRDIALSHFGDGTSLIDQVVTINKMSQAGRCKHLTKGKRKQRCQRRPTFTQEELDLLAPFLPPNLTERIKWLRSELFLNACRALGSRKEPGEIIAEVFGLSKKYRK